MTKRRKDPPEHDDRQQDLFALPPDIPLDVPSQPFDTSEAAANSVRIYAHTLRWKVLVAVWRHNGLTQDQCAAMLAVGPQTSCPRFWELERRGLLYKTALKRPTRSGRQAIVYHCTPRGIEVARHVAAAGVDAP